MPDPAPLLVVDAPSLLYRAFFALPSSIKGSDGRPVNALLGTANLLVQAVDASGPRRSSSASALRRPATGRRLWPGYHADRPPMPDDLVPQWADAPAFFAAFGWASEHAGDLEADDLLGAFATLESDAGGRAVLFTGDRDMFQCVTDR